MVSPAEQGKDWPAYPSRRKLLRCAPLPMAFPPIAPRWRCRCWTCPTPRLQLLRGLVEHVRRAAFTVVAEDVQDVSAAHRSTELASLPPYNRKAHPGLMPYADMMLWATADGTNWIGLWTLYRREVRRFLAVAAQTAAGPAVTTLLFLVVFTVVMNSRGAAQSIGGLPYLEFLAPGLVIMTMAQNAFTNTALSLLIAKAQSNVADLLVAPLSAGELRWPPRRTSSSSTLRRGATTPSASWHGTSRRQRRSIWARRHFPSAPRSVGCADAP